MTLWGTAARWNELTAYPRLGAMGARLGLKPVREEFAPGAFTASLRSRQRIDFLMMHEDSSRIASTRDGSLRLFEDREGLKFFASPPADAPETTRFMRAVKLVGNGQMTGISPGWQTDDWEYFETGGEVIRVIKTATLSELSIVDAPAFRATRVRAAGSVPLFLLREQLDSLMG